MAVPVREDETDRPPKVWASLFLQVVESLCNSIPVHDVPERVDKFCPVVPVVNVIRMLPHVKDHKDIETGDYVRVVFLDLEDERPHGFTAECKGSPSGSLRTHRCLGKLFFKPIEF